MLPSADLWLSRGKVNSETSCWEWQSKGAKGGYGRIYIGRKGYSVHRLAAALFLGFDIDSDELVCHRCDNPPCFNPDHLFIGTQSDNCLDRSQKGRGRENRQRGVANPNVKLSERAVGEIREALERGETQTSLSKRYGVVQPHISRIARYAQRREE